MDLVDPNPQLNRKLLAVGIGNVMEWFDFAVFGGLIDAIGYNFFPQNNTTNRDGKQLFFGLIVFGVAFVMRPLGGLALGIIGDTKGRRNGLMLSISLMLIPSFLIGCLPTYQQIGFTASGLLVVCRLMQGFAGGGEMVGAIVYIVEQAKYSGYPTFYGSLCKATGNLGSTLGLGLVASLRYFLSDKIILEWAWRIPFLSSVIFGVVGMLIRLQLLDDIDEGITPLIPDDRHSASPNIFKQLIEIRADILVTALVSALWSVSYYTILVWLIYFLQDPEQSCNTTLSKPMVWILSFFMNVMVVLLMPLFGIINDFLNKGPTFLLKLSSILFILLSCPLFFLFTVNRKISIITAYFIFVVLISTYGYSYAVRII